MTMKIIFLIVAILLIVALILAYTKYHSNRNNPIPSPPPSMQSTSPDTPDLSIPALKSKNYPGSNLTISDTLSPGANYNRYLVYYYSDNLKIYGLLTVPDGTKPQDGWPVILLNHGYIPPNEYSTIQSYSSFVDPLAQAGFIVFKPDYRGNGNSEGQPSQPYISSADVTDSMNALSSISKYKEADPNRIGILGHSMGGFITLTELVITNKFKAADILAGVVGNQESILNWWDERIKAGTIEGNDAQTATIIEQLIKEHGTPRSNPQFWEIIDPTHFIDNIQTPIEIQVGLDDFEVPPNFSESLRASLLRSHKTVSYFEYPNADHNLSPDTSLVLQRSITFFKKYL